MGAGWIKYRALVKNLWFGCYCGEGLQDGIAIKESFAAYRALVKDWWCWCLFCGGPGGGFGCGVGGVCALGVVGVVVRGVCARAPVFFETVFCECSVSISHRSH